MRAELNSHRARLAAKVRHHPEDAEGINESRRELMAGRAEDYIRRLITSAPPLTTEQRDRLAVLLRGSATEIVETRLAS